MVYVELRALLGDDWSKSLKVGSPFDNDKYLKHMPTPEMNALSYSQLSALIKLIDEHWACFAEYLPPKDLWTAKLTEISQIRHRIAHFRVGHVDDHSRVIQFLRDVDKGFWTFCTSYNDGQPVLPLSNDPVMAHFLPLHPLPWVEIQPRQWAQVGTVNKSPVIGVTVNLLTRPWADSTQGADGKPGHLYDVTLLANDDRKFDYGRLLENSQNHHAHVVHLCLDSFESSFRLTLPAVLGSKRVIELVERFIETGKYNVARSHPTRPSPDALADEWPEYVLGPSDPLTFLDPEMKCSFFGV